MATTMMAAIRGPHVRNVPIGTRHQEITYAETMKELGV
jgi:hypothetical protein